MQMNFGSSQQPARIAFDTASAFLAVSSDICFNCPTQAYKPGGSKTTHNTGLQWDLAYPISKMNLGVIEFSDYIWLSDAVYLSSFDFYAIYEEKGLPSDVDGFLGITTKASQEPSFLQSLVKSGQISQPSVGVHIDGTTGELTFGSQSCTQVEGGCQGISWLQISNLTEWQIQTTRVSFNDSILSQKTRREVVIHAGSPLVGLETSDFTLLKQKLANLQFDCSDVCLSRLPCEQSDLQEGLELRFTETFDATIPATDLMQDLNESEYQCKFLAFDSGDRYILGNPFLKSYYVVFDMDSSVIGIGKKVVSTQEVVKTDPEKDLPLPEENQQGENSETQIKKDLEMAVLIAVSLVLIIVAICFVLGRLERRKGLIPKDSMLTADHDNDLVEYRRRRLSVVRSFVADSEQSNYLIK